MRRLGASDIGTAFGELSVRPSRRLEILKERCLRARNANHVHH
jgi:hypothetical protein